jgi:hypothetical protein
LGVPANHASINGSAVVKALIFHKAFLWLKRFTDRIVTDKLGSFSADQGLLQMASMHVDQNPRSKSPTPLKRKRQSKVTKYVQPVNLDEVS